MDAICRLLLDSTHKDKDEPDEFNRLFKSNPMLVPADDFTAVSTGDCFRKASIRVLCFIDAAQCIAFGRIFWSYGFDHRSFRTESVAKSFNV